MEQLDFEEFYKQQHIDELSLATVRGEIDKWINELQMNLTQLNYSNNLKNFIGWDDIKLLYATVRNLLSATDFLKCKYIKKGGDKK